jgi:hypothetical protein
MANDQRRTPPVTRRHVLRTIGAGSLLATVPGTAAAEGNIGPLHDADETDDQRTRAEPGGGDRSGQVKNTCPEGTALLAKYNLDDNGEFVFETGREELGIDGTEITISNVVTKPSEPSQVVGFDWDAGVYDVHSVGVKFGTEVERWSLDDPATTGTIDVRDRYQGEQPIPAISNVIFCIRVHWQVDFGIGPVLNPPRYGNGSGDSELVMAAFGRSPESDQYDENPAVGPYVTHKPIRILGEPDRFDLSDGTATVRFAVIGSESVPVHLASFETPGRFKGSEIRSQVLLESAELVADPGVHELEVPLPTL